MNRDSTTAAAGALLVCAVALGGCGEQAEPKQETLGYGNYQPRGQHQKSPQTESLGYGNYQPGLQEQPGQQDEPLGTPDRFTHDYAHIAE
ncbi:MAG: hypothetical protein GX555_07740 [Actinomycetales bacterium]|nr:hypothetical protein [Actinomycetales bacterium]